MPGLLVSVRSAEEARAAVRGGANVIDVKEPDRGPLGRASAEVIDAVREAVPRNLPVSMALGELRDWKSGPDATRWDRLPKTGARRGRAGLAKTMGRGPPLRPGWAALGRGRLRRLGKRLLTPTRPRPRCCPGRSRRRGLVARYLGQVAAESAHTLARMGRMGNASPGSGGGSSPLAGRLDRSAIVRLSSLRPDLFAVRGAACGGGDRLGKVDADRVADLAQVVATGRRQISVS